LLSARAIGFAAMVRITPTGLCLWSRNLVTSLLTSPLALHWLSSVTLVQLSCGLVAYQPHL